jgi:hypothetical protein
MKQVKLTNKRQSFNLIAFLLVSYFVKFNCHHMATLVVCFCFIVGRFNLGANSGKQSFPSSEFDRRLERKPLNQSRTFWEQREFFLFLYCLFSSPESVGKKGRKR